VAAESSRPKLMFETGNPVRYYLPLADVHTDLLTKSEYISACPYKGDRQHWHLSAGGDTVTTRPGACPTPQRHWPQTSTCASTPARSTSK
jgi:uncharacterized protein (DUF427 family)